MLRSNPYLIVGEEFGVEFSQADQLALSLGVGGRTPSAWRQGLLFELAHNLNNGHSFLPRRKLIEATAILLDVSGGLLEPCLEALAGRGEVVCEAVAGRMGYICPPFTMRSAMWPGASGEMSRSELLPPDDLDKLIARIQRDQGIRYAPQQREAVELAACRQVMLLTGGPGTGKTTSLRGVLALFETLGLETALAAPTGRAAKRLGELCGTEASTIHRLLETGFDPTAGVWSSATGRTTL